MGGRVRKLAALLLLAFLAFPGAAAANGGVTGLVTNTVNGATGTVAKVTDPVTTAAKLPSVRQVPNQATPVVKAATQTVDRDGRQHSRRGRAGHTDGQGLELHPSRGRSPARPATSLARSSALRRTASATPAAGVARTTPVTRAVGRALGRHRAGPRDHRRGRADGSHRRVAAGSEDWDRRGRGRAPRSEQRPRLHRGRAARSGGRPPRDAGVGPRTRRSAGPGRFPPPGSRPRRAPGHRGAACRERPRRAGPPTQATHGVRGLARRASGRASCSRPVPRAPQRLAISPTPRSSAPLRPESPSAPFRPCRPSPLGCHHERVGGRTERQRAAGPIAPRPSGGARRRGRDGFQRPPLRGAGRALRCLRASLLGVHPHASHRAGFPAAGAFHLLARAPWLGGVRLRSGPRRGPTSS